MVQIALVRVLRVEVSLNPFLIRAMVQIQLGVKKLQFVISLNPFLIRAMVQIKNLLTVYHLYGLNPFLIRAMVQILAENYGLPKVHVS